ncbi:MAG: ribonuclease III domain-containing protein [Halanaerobium sp.]|nr:ribonuclease III domain-containing protein [Halanaerobium sp.]
MGPLLEFFARLRENLHKEKNKIEREEAGLPFPDRSGQLPAPDVLAYLGDAVFELFVRTYLVQRGGVDSHSLHREAVEIVNASTQADILHAIRPYLSEEELRAFKRGRNTKSGQVPKNTSVADYRSSTGLESLLGYLYWRGEQARLEQLLKRIILHIKEEDILH